MKTLKSSFWVIGLLGLMVLTQSLVGFNKQSPASAFDEPDKDKVIKIKVIKNVNGVETVIDTTITLTDDMNIDEVLSNLNISGCCMNGLSNNLFNIQINDDSLESDSVQMKCIKIIKTGSEDGEIVDLENIINVAIADENNAAKCKMIVIKDSLIEKKIVMNNANKTMKCVVIGDDITTNDFDVSKCDSIVKKIVMNMESSDDGSITQQMWISEDGELKEFNGDVDVEVINDGDKKVVIIAKVKIDELDANDKKALAKSGVNTSVEELDLSNLKISPNPNKGKFNLNFENENEGDMRIRVYDSNGREVYDQKLKNFKGNYNSEIDLSQKSKGVYYINISQDRKAITKKILLQ